MEYLMTYGWAILVIAIIAGILFALGIFGQSSSGLPNGCTPQTGFICANPSYTPNGIVLTVGQESSQYYYGDWVFVASTSEGTGAGGLPENFTSPLAANMLPIGPLTPGQTMTVDFTNTTAGDIPTANVLVGQPLTAYVWLGYCTVPGCKTPTSYTKIGTLNTKFTGATLSGGSSTPTPTPPTTGNVVFATDSLPAGTTWSVTYNGVMESNTIPSNIVFTGIPTSALLPYTVNSPLVGSSACYSASGASGTTGVDVVPITFSLAPCYVPITLTSSNQNGVPSSNFQQMISVPSSSYASNGESANLQNVEFTTGPAGTGTALQAWCESGCTSGSTSLWWVNLGTTSWTPGSSANTLIIYMDFMLDNVMSASGPTGEAPQLFGSPYAQSSYGQYDNGGSVFSYYKAWGGLSSLPTGWSTGGTCPSTPTFNSRNTTFYATCNSYSDLYTSTVPTTGQSADFFGVFWESAGNGQEWGLATHVQSGSTDDPGSLSMCAGGSGNGASTPKYSLASSTTCGYNGWGTTSYYGVFGLDYVSNSAGAAWFNYTEVASSTSLSESTPSYFEFVPYNPSNPAITVYWIRYRNTPPNGVMPHASFDSVV